MAEVGTPVIGDVRYGRPFSPAPPRMALHAMRLGFEHPRLGTPLAFESALPRDLEKWLTETMWRNTVTQ